jgi:uncharacterized damage-inducible protein DinB
MNRYFSQVLLAALAVSALHAQDALVGPVKQSYTSVKNNLLKAADKMPDENYSFKPTPEVQNWGQRVAHMADSNIGTCARLKGEQKSVGAASKTSKADLVAALKESFAYCDTVFDAATDADAVQMVNAGRGGQRSKISVLWGLVAHDNEVYGAMGVYMRLKGIVPPSSEAMAGR